MSRWTRRPGRGGKLPALSAQEQSDWDAGTFTDAKDASEEATAEEWEDAWSRPHTYLDGTFAEANAASVSQWNPITNTYERTDMGKNKKAIEDKHTALATNQSKQWTPHSPATYTVGKSGVVETLSKADKCTHEGITPVLTIPHTGTQLFAASSGFAREACYLADMAIDVGAHIADSSSTAPFVSVRGVCSEATKTAIQSLNSHTVSLPPIVRLDWPDMGIPPAGLAFWRALVNLLPPHGRVVVACIGSHGRTGTLLASLLIVTQGMTAREAIDYVRKHHCKKAVESLAQEKYLQSLSDAMQADAKR